MLQLSDYTLDTSGIDWGEAFASWAWILPAEFTLWIVNRFGEPFLVLEDGSVHRLDLGCGTLDRLVDSRDAFAEAIHEGEHAQDWFLAPLVDRLREAGIHLKAGECYGFIQLPVFGGAYSIENIRPMALAHVFKALGPILEGIKEIPDGERVKFRIISGR
ncbi:MAG: DUF1851 domain-containing protein [Holophagaceae bacterium]